MAALSGYTLLAAVTAYAIVRFGKVWEDARSLLLILLFLFLALSVSFDEIVNTTSQLGQGLLLFGFCLSVVISEGLLTGLGIRLPGLYRWPYYLLLGLFFGYPLWVSPEVTELPVEVLRRRIMLFPALAAVPFLALIPAVRRGARYTLPNGTPWRWPWVPWPMFLFLALAVCAVVRALDLFRPGGGHEQHVRALHPRPIPARGTGAFARTGDCASLEGAQTIGHGRGLWVGVSRPSHG